MLRMNNTPLVQMHLLRHLVLRMHLIQRSPCAQNPRCSRRARALRVVCVSGLQLRYCAAVGARARQHLVLFVVEEVNGGLDDGGGGGGGGCWKLLVEVMAIGDIGGKGMVGSSRGRGRGRSKGRHIHLGAECVWTHVATQHHRLTERHFAVSAAGVRHPCKVTLAFVAGGGGGGGGRGRWFGGDEGGRGRGGGGCL
jgi:hypothetical protein